MAALQYVIKVVILTRLAMIILMYVNLVVMNTNPKNVFPPSELTRQIA